jgi:hypothetical protein
MERTCKTCVMWERVLQRPSSLGVLEGLCVNRESPMYQHWMTYFGGCGKHTVNDQTTSNLEETGT